MSLNFFSKTKMFCDDKLYIDFIFKMFFQALNFTNNKNL